MTELAIASYTAASGFPSKLLQCPGVVDSDKRIHPIHLQINPTNRCNLNCAFCSCSARNKADEIPSGDLLAIADMAADLGSKSFTITGGGEPVLHPGLPDFVARLVRNGIKSGMVTNGSLADRIEPWGLTWNRVSFSDDRDTDLPFFARLAKAVERCPDVDWSWSYVLTASPSWGRLRRIVAFASDYGFCHIRLVGDLTNPDSVPNMGIAKKELVHTPGNELVIYQPRTNSMPGSKRCLISLVKPTIAADGGVWPCCGAQYAIDRTARDFPANMRMGHWKDLPVILENQEWFDGSRCLYCYYSMYNDVLGEMVRPLNHLEFV